MMNMTSAEFSAALDGFAAGLQRMIYAHYTTQFPNLTPKTVELEHGRRYVKVFTGDQTSRSVHSFIDKTNGNVLMAASYKAPAKHARGNILTADFGLSAVTVYGAHYMR